MPLDSSSLILEKPNSPSGFLPKELAWEVMNYLKVFGEDGEETHYGESSLFGRENVSHSSLN